MQYAGPNIDDMRLWKVTFIDGTTEYFESRNIVGASTAAYYKYIPVKPIVKVEFDLCLHDNDWWDGQAEGADCPYSDWS